MDDLNEMHGFEKYTLILKHEYIDKDGKFLLEQPLMVSAVASLQNEVDIVPINKLIQRLTEEMKHVGLGWM